jgi:hypothetical protein
VASDPSVVIEIKTVGVDEAKAQFAALQEAQKGLMAPLPPALFGIAEPIKQAEESTKNLTNQFGLAGASINKAQGEALVLARELATGSVNARTLGALLGSLGTSITVASIAGIGLEKIITAIADDTLKIAENAAKQEKELGKSVGQWAEISKYAQDLGDEVHLADKIKEQLDKMAGDMATFRTEQESLWGQFSDAVASRFGSSWTETLTRLSLAIPTFGASIFAGGSGPTPHAQQVADQAARMAKATQDANIATDNIQRSVALWSYYQDHVGEGIQFYTNQVSQLQAKINALDVQRHLDPTNAKTLDNYREVKKDLDDATHKLSTLQGWQDKLDNSTDQERDTRERITELLREQTTIIQGINQNRQLIEQNPFMSVNDKSVALLKSYSQEMGQLQSQMRQLSSLKMSGLLDPAQAALIDNRIQQTDFRIKSLTQSISALKAPLTTELMNWANSFGDTWKQVGHSMEQSIETALDALNQGLITGKFNARELVQHLANIGLQLLEHIAIQQIMAAIARTNRAENIAAGPATATAWAPAAAATSVGTGGTAAVTGEAAALAAIFDIIGAIVAHKGGQLGRGGLRRMHMGGLAHDEVPIIAQTDEIMVQRSIALPFANFLLSLNSGDPTAMGLASMFHGGGIIPRYHGGGGLAPAEGSPRYWMMINELNPGWQPPANLDQSPSGPHVIVPRDYSGDSSKWDFGDSPRQSNWYNNMMSQFSNWGYSPPTGTLGWFQGPTMIPTFFDAQGYPFAVPVTAGAYTNPSDPTGLMHGSQGHLNTKVHSGGRIGGPLGNLTLPSLPRFHSGGATPAMRGGRGGAGGAINIAAFIDHHAMGKWLSGQKGRNIIFDTINGRKIELGIPG